jgi:hypothetical protein
VFNNVLQGFIASSFDAPNIFITLSHISSVSDVNHESNFRLSQYAQNTPVGTDGNGTSCLYLGIDLENYSNTPLDTVYSGLNTSSDDVVDCCDRLSSPTVRDQTRPAVRPVVEGHERFSGRRGDRYFSDCHVIFSSCGPPSAPVTSVLANFGT